MFYSQFSEKTKIFQFKDIISIFIVIVLISVPICNVFASTVKSSSNNVLTARDFVIFSSISYANLENIKGYNITMNNKNNKTKVTSITSSDLTFKETTMVTDSQLSKITIDTSIAGIELAKELPKNNDAKSFLFRGLASTSEVSDWKIVNYAKFNTTAVKGKAQFTAMTFKRGNDIVIAYRGTDVEVGDIGQDILYGIVGATGQETLAKNYALEVAKYYKDIKPNIYITGWSLGGYLAQFGGAALIDNKNYKDSLKGIYYFNGIGLDFWSNIISKADKTLKNSKTYKKVKDIHNNIHDLQIKTYNTLRNAYNKGTKIISYEIQGDIVSSLGKHAGKRISLKATLPCIYLYGAGDSKKINTKAITTILNIIKPFLNKDITPYPQIYQTPTITSYFILTHLLTSFLDSNNITERTLNNKSNSNNLQNLLRIELSTPSSVYRNSTYTANLTIISQEGDIGLSQYLTKDNFEINSSLLKIESISKPSRKYYSGGTVRYTYTIKLKGINNTYPKYTNIHFKEDSIKLYNLKEAITISNKKLSSSSILVY